MKYRLVLNFLLLFFYCSVFSAISVKKTGTEEAFFPSAPSVKKTDVEETFFSIEKEFQEFFNLYSISAEKDHLKIELNDVNFKIKNSVTENEKQVLVFYKNILEKIKSLLKSIETLKKDYQESFFQYSEIFNQYLYSLNIKEKHLKRDCSYNDFIKHILYLDELEKQVKICQEKETRVINELEELKSNIKNLKRMNEFSHDELSFGNFKKRLLKEIGQAQDKLEKLKEYSVGLKIRIKELEKEKDFLKKKGFEDTHKAALEEYRKIKANFCIGERSFKNFSNHKLEREKELSIEKSVLEDKLNNNLVALEHYHSEFFAPDDKHYGEISSKIEKILLIIKNEKNIFQKIDYIEKAIVFADHYVVDLIDEFKIFYIDLCLKYNQKSIEQARYWMALTNSKAFDKELKDIVSAIEGELYENDKNEIKKREDTVFSEYKIILNARDVLKDYLKEITGEGKLDSLDEKRYINNIFDKIDQFTVYYDTLRKNIFSISSQALELIEKDEIINTYVLKEIQDRAFWKRSQHSLGKEELLNFAPNIKIFMCSIINDFKPFINNFFSVLFFKKAFSIKYLMYFFVALILFVGIWLAFRFFMPFLYNFLISKSSQSVFCAKIALFISFLLQYQLFYVWSSLFIISRLPIITSNYLLMIFNLFSIIYLFYFFTIFFKWFYQTNNSRGFIFISSDYINRFIYIFSFFTYVSIFIYFFREAILCSPLYRSSVPTILLATHFILIQITLIAFLRKDQLLNLLPEYNPIASLIRYFIDKYYNACIAIVVAVIVMSNPYVGYGKQVLYMVSRFLITFFIVPLIIYLYNMVKKIVEPMFFYQNDQEAVQNRIPGGRAWYACSILLLFFLMIVGCYVILGYVWGFQVNYQNIRYYIKYNFVENIGQKAGESASLSLYALGKVFLFIVGGYFATYIINSFVLQRILNPLMLGQGIQNTVLTLSRYILVISAFLIGLHSAGLDSLTTKIAFILGAIGFAIKEPFADIISYFIILIQRPIKVGDLIRIYGYSANEEVTGVVRQVTPRSTLIRQNNSHIIIVPNSMILTKSLINWNYVKGFISAEDIFIHIDFEHDPEEIKQIFHKIVEMHPAILKNPIPVIRCREFTAVGYLFMIRCFIASERSFDLFEISSQLRILIAKKLKVYNIKIAKPHYIIETIKDKDRVD